MKLSPGDTSLAVRLALTIFLLIFLCACSSPAPTIEVYTSESAWAAFEAQLNDLVSYTYETQYTGYRNFLNGQESPSESLLQGAAADGLIYREHLFNYGRVGWRTLFQSGIVYLPVITSLEGETWSVTNVPNVPIDIGQPFVLRELIGLGVEHRFIGQTADGAFGFELVVPQTVMSEWLDVQFELNKAATINAGYDYPREGQQVIRTVYDLLEVEQVITLLVTRDGLLLETDTPLNTTQFGEVINYLTTYADFNNPSIQVPQPEIQ